MVLIPQTTKEVGALLVYHSIHIGISKKVIYIDPNVRALSLVTAARRTRVPVLREKDELAS